MASGSKQNGTPETGRIGWAFGHMIDGGLNAQSGVSRSDRHEHNCLYYWDVSISTHVAGMLIIRDPVTNGVWLIHQTTLLPPDRR